MFTYQPMSPEDIFSLDVANMDRKSENFTFEYYLYYLQNQPDHFITIRRYDPAHRYEKVVNTGGIAPQGRGAVVRPSSLSMNPVIAYIFGKLEIKDQDQLCIHISGLTVSPSCRTNGLGSALLRYFHHNGNCARALFSDLFVRASNTVAIGFYERNGYCIYRRVMEYYGSPTEDAYDMRRPLDADCSGQSLLGGVDISAYDL